MFDDEIRQHEDDHRPCHRSDGVGAERREILPEVFRVALQLTGERCPDILQAPAADDSIIAGNEKSRQHTHVTDDSPGGASGQFTISPGGVGLSVAANDEFADHAGDAQHQHTAHIDDDKHGTAVLASHIGEAPHVAQSHGRTRRSQNNT